MRTRAFQTPRRPTPVPLTRGERSISTLSDWPVVPATNAVLPVRDAWWFVPHAVAQAPGRPTLGSDDFPAENPAFGALIPVYAREVPMTARARRQAAERAQCERNADVPFPGYDQLRDETLERDPGLQVVITDASGRRVRILPAPSRAGLHRSAWDLRAPSPEPVNLDPPGFRPPWSREPVGPLVAPGRYTASLELVSSGGVRQLGESGSFEVKPVPNLGEVDVIAVAALQSRAAGLARQRAAIGAEISQLREELRRMRATLAVTPGADAGLFARVDSAGAVLAALQRRMSGDPVRGRLDQANEVSIGSRVGSATSSFGTRQVPTATQERDAELGGPSWRRLGGSCGSWSGGRWWSYGRGLMARGR